MQTKLIEPSAARERLPFTKQALRLFICSLLTKLLESPANLPKQRNFNVEENEGKRTTLGIKPCRQLSGTSGREHVDGSADVELVGVSPSQALQ